MTEIERARRVELSGSHRELEPARVIGPPDKDIIRATIVIEEAGLVDWPEVDGFIATHHLTNAYETSLTIVVDGAPEDMEKAFGTKLELVDHETLGTFRRRSGPITVPAPVAPYIHAVLGLDDRPVAKPHHQFHPDHWTTNGTLKSIEDSDVPHASVNYTPPQVAKAYGFPTDADGTGVLVGIIELGGGFTQADLTAYLKTLGVTQTGAVKAVGVDGAKSKSDGADGADGEVMLDVEVVASIAPGADINVYFAPNTDAGFLDAITRAYSDGCEVISISWGGPEESWTAASRSSFDKIFANASLVSTFVASGDSGSSDGVTDGKVHVDFPASSPNVTACGGTKLVVSPPSEVVWNDGATTSATGGGVSSEFPLPSYQANAKVPTQFNTKKVGRGVPDVSGNADPNTGYQVRIDGGSYVIGGTSAVAPLWAALAALLNQKTKTSVGFLNHTLYAIGGLKDIATGNNGSYTAKPGVWDACTGLGSPDVAKILTELGDSPTPPPPPVDPPPVTPPPTAPTVDKATVIADIAATKKSIDAALDALTSQVQGL